MKSSEIAALLNEPACAHNNKEKSGCAKPKPGATAGGCSFDGAQIALVDRENHSSCAKPARLILTMF